MNKINNKEEFVKQQVKEAILNGADPDLIDFRDIKLSNILKVNLERWKEEFGYKKVELNHKLPNGGEK